ncbi:hypothetical protein [Solimicrobium silvestre]|uniref:Uncharacterized protein n=1 Tax=Solimicrobium silvestre TaxID=2099400 RepID=A0A2S9GXG9_9BURK|nr:hypothetical protein [Solimicrobium silvestre]PRC92417.1 hypothetical protein S2091_2792 [Solimicrobium silvestre]
MKRLLLAALLAASPLLSMAQVNVDVNIGAPNFYGQVDLENDAPPPVVFLTPVVVQQVPSDVYYPPVYLRVPETYYQHWPQYCAMYNACYQPVFFVQESWYLQVYAPMYRSRYPYGRPGFTPRAYYGAPRYDYGPPRYDDRRDHRNERHDDRRDERRDDDRR